MTVLSNPADGADSAAGAYVAAVLEMLGSRPALDVLQETPEVLRTATDGVSDAELFRPEGPGRWSVGEVVAHLADSEFVWANRMRFVLAESAPQLQGYDQDAWANRLGYRQIPLGASLAAFAGARLWNLALLERVEEPELDRVGRHAERGEESLRFMMRLYAGHDLVHLSQVRRILSGSDAAATS